MQFIEWNKIISSHFFNHENAGKNTYLYITKTDILQMAIPFFNGESEQKIWEDFLDKIENGDQDRISKINIVERSIGIFEEWEKTDLNLNEDIFPPYIIYLAFLVLPLIEIQGEYNSNNYYDRLDNFLTENNIKQNLRNRLREIDILWKDLANWANIINNGELGLFHIKNFINPKWIYVGKIFSQFVFPPRAIRKLPIFFLQSEMIPNSIYTSENCKRDLIKFGASALMLSRNIIDIIRISETNELGQSIIDTTRKEYKKWTGESHSVDETGSTARTKRNDISSRIYLQLQIFSNEGRIEFSYRMKSAIEFAEDLTFNGIEIREEKLGYSTTLNLPFKESFQLKDDFNKWVAKFPDKDVRLFISAGSLQFSTDYWIESDTLSKTHWMYLLCKNSLSEKILIWGKNQCSQFINETDLQNLPDNYSLFRFSNPRQGIEEIPVLTIINEKDIQLVSALRVDFRTFTDDFLPEVEIQNSDGTEKVYLQYKNNEEKFFLKKIPNSDRWLLPEEIYLYSDFNIRAEGETFSGNETTYKIISSNGSGILVNEQKLPKRDSFGNVTYENLTEYSVGSNTVGTNLLIQSPYMHLFRGTKKDSNMNLSKPVYKHTEGNILISFLTLKGTSTAQDFYSAFEFLHSKYFVNLSNDFNYSKIKKASLNFFDYLGYLDYEYETKSVVVSPPQLIFIPASEGRKVLLIGGRDVSLVNGIVETAPKFNLQVEITSQFQSNKSLLLPDAITLKSYGNATRNYGENNIILFAKELNIRFNPTELVQVRLQQFCNDIDKYEKELLANKETNLTYEDWARYIFNIETLALDQSFSENFEKSFTMLEYRLRPWEYYHRLWINDKCYQIDRNWGKYLVLKHYNKNVILFDRSKKRVAIPLELPLPRLLAESIMLLSGIAPDFRIIDGKKYRIFENINEMFTKNLFYNLSQIPKETNL